DFIGLQLIDLSYDNCDLRERVRRSESFSTGDVLEIEPHAVGGPDASGRSPGSAATREHSTVRCANVDFDLRCARRAPGQSHLNQAGTVRRLGRVGRYVEEAYGIGCSSRNSAEVS